jgi:hypothetical protein
MATVFFHVPRTGGSTAWYSLAHSTRNGRPLVLDLFHHSNLIFGTAYIASGALRNIEADRDISKVDVFFHHHTRQNITQQLPPDKYLYVTIVRDPVERFISEIFHVRNMIVNDGFVMGEFEYYRDSLSGKLFANLCDNPTSVSPDELLLLAAEEPFYRNYYINTFWGLLFGGPEKSIPKYLQDTELVLPALLSAVKNNFAFVGRYSHIQDSIQKIAHIVGIPYKAADMIVVNASGPAKPSIQRTTLERLRELNRADYQFLELLADPCDLGDQATLFARRGAAEAALTAAHTSHSWYFTAPLRGVATLLRDRFGRGRFSPYPAGPASTMCDRG